MKLKETDFYEHPDRRGKLVFMNSEYRYTGVTDDDFTTFFDRVRSANDTWSINAYKNPGDETWTATFSRSEDYTSNEGALEDAD